MRVTLKIEGFNGNSTLIGHSGEIEIASYHIGNDAKLNSVFILSFCCNPEEGVSKTHLLDVAQKRKNISKATFCVSKDDLGLLSEVQRIEMNNIEVINDGYDQTGNNKFTFKSNNVLITMPNSGLPKSWDIKQSLAI